MEQSLEIMKRYRESKKRRAESFEENQPIDKSDEVMETPLLEILKRVDPKKFELLCLLLLREHGFDDVTVTPYSHDEGIDVFGTLKTTPFVSMKVAFQCKRYNDKNPISRSHVDDFRGSISGKAEKGGIITTGRFSREAMDSANRQGTLPIELIDGQRLVELFEEVSLGLKPKQVYEIDYSFFDQYM
jgi:restriction system protein